MTIAMFLVCITAMWMFLLLWILSWDQKNSRDWILDSGWQVSRNDTLLESRDTLSAYEFLGLQRGEQIRLVHLLPEDMPTGQTMTFYGSLSAIEVMVDGEELYAYGQQELRAHELVGSGFHFVHLPDDAAGKELVIIVTAGETGAFSGISAPTFGDSDTLYQTFARRRMVNLGICIYLCMMGALIIFLSAVSLCFTKEAARLLCIGIFSFLVGLWSLCEMKVLQIFNVNLAANTAVEYLVKYLIGVAFFLMIWEINRKTAPWRERGLLAVVLMLAAFVAVAVVLQLSGVLHLPRLLRAYHVLVTVGLILALIFGTGARKKRDRVSRIMFLGMILMGIGLAVDMIRSNVSEFLLRDQERLSHSIVPFCALVFLLMLFISYIFFLYDLVTEKAEQDRLKDIAYHDDLCHIYNRAKCREEFQRLDHLGREYALINIDLNGLKSINDNSGHSQGDLLLQEFAAILQRSFSGVGNVFRMGGDEFLVIVHKEQFRLLDQAIAAMERQERKRSSQLPFTIDASYGVAYSEECSPSRTDRVYALADQRMYEMKRQKKWTRGSDPVEA